MVKNRRSEAENGKLVSSLSENKAVHVNLERNSERKEDGSSYFSKVSSSEGGAPISENSERDVAEVHRRYDKQDSG